MKTMYLSYLLGLVAIGLQSCTANAPQDGFCVRSCGSRPIGGGKIKGVALDEKGVVFENCQVGSELPQLTYRFYIYEDLSDSNAGGTSNSESSGESTGGTNAQFPNRMGKAGISITPLVGGYNRIDTPTKDWCTDSCGYAEIAFTPTCFEQETNVGLVAPGMMFEGEGPPSTPFNVKFD